MSRKWFIVDHVLEKVLSLDDEESIQTNDYESDFETEDDNASEMIQTTLTNLL